MMMSRIPSNEKSLIQRSAFLSPRLCGTCLRTVLKPAWVNIFCRACEYVLVCASIQPTIPRFPGYESLAYTQTLSLSESALPTGPGRIGLPRLGTDAPLTYLAAREAEGRECTELNPDVPSMFGTGLDARIE